MVKLLNDPALRARLGIEGRAYAAGWNAGALARRLADAYRDVTGTNSRVLPGLGGLTGTAPAAKVAVR